MPKSKQIAAVPVRQAPHGGYEVLLVTSRETQRWVIPKGWPWPKLPDHEAAAKEAWEEAGVRGVVQPDAIGTYHYDKRLGSKTIHVAVAVFLLEVTREEKRWPENKQRRRSWFSPDAAAEAVDEPELKELLTGLTA